MQSLGGELRSCKQCGSATNKQTDKPTSALSPDAQALKTDIFCRGATLAASSSATCFELGRRHQLFGALFSKSVLANFHQDFYLICGLLRNTFSLFQIKRVFKNLIILLCICCSFCFCVFFPLNFKLFILCWDIAD